MLDRRSAIHAPHPDMCEWILGLKHYTEWRDRDRGPLWIKGKPRAGKSTLITFLHKRLKKQLDPNAMLLEFFNRTMNQPQVSIDLETYSSPEGFPSLPLVLLSGMY
jgi:hypothetical protein